MQRLQDGEVEDDDSLLQESQQEPDKEAKQVIVNEQRYRRKKEREASLEQARAEEQHRLDNLAALDRRFKSQMKDFQKQKAAQKRLEKKKEALKKKKIDQIVKMHQGSHMTTQVVKVEKPAERVQTQSPGSQQQLVELRAWIEQQMKNEEMFNAAVDPNEANDAPDFNSSAPKIVSIQVTEKPGLKKEQEKNEKVKKSKSRERSAKQLPKVEQEQKQPTSPQKSKKQHPLKNLQQELPGNKNLSEEEKAKLPNSRKNRYGVFPPNDGNNYFDKAVENQRRKMETERPQPAHDFDEIQEALDSSADPVSEESCDHVPVRESSRPFVGNRREVLNQPANLKKQPSLPGTMNIKQQAEELARKKKEREVKAVVVIQKWVRGHFGRKAAIKQRAKISRAIDEEYGRFERDVKRSRDYDLKRYLQDKKKIREKTGLKSHESMDSIAEVIGESTSTNKAPKVSSGSSAFAALFKSRQIDKDPLSLISVFAKKHGNTPNIHKEKQKKERRKAKDHKTKPKGVATSSSIIEEDYPEDFEESVPKTSTTSTILEDIPFSNQSSIKLEKVSKSATTSKGLVPAVGAVNQTKTAKQFTDSRDKKKPVKESPLESIADEVIDEVESIVDEVPGMNPAKKDTDTEDEIIRDEYENDNSRAADAIKKIEARNRIRFGLASDKTDDRSKKQVQKETVILGMGEQREQMALQRQRVMNELLGELKEYERAHISTTVIDRMEKVVVSSLAQKDQLIMGQRLAELEREAKHQQEIARLREEQIKMMTNMMMLGFGQPNASVTDKQREEAMEMMKKLIEQPVTIKQETVHVNYSVNKVPAQIADLAEISLAEELANSQSRQKRKTYLEEFEESRKRESEAKAKPLDDIEDEIPDEVVPSIEHSIQEEIEQSAKSSASQSQSTVFRNNAFQEYKQEKLSRAKATEMHQVLSQIELAILKEKDEREQELAAKLKKKKITSRAYDRGVNEVEKWVKNERKDLQDIKVKIDYDYRNVKTLINDLHQEKQTLTEKVGLSPQRSRHFLVSQSEQLGEDSRDSDGVKEAIRQSQQLRAGLAPSDPDQKYLEKKRQVAANLLEEKEKAIQKGLMTKLAALEAENADEMMKRALDMNVQSEINKRFELARKMIEESGSINESLNSNQEKPKKEKKNVQFAPDVGKQEQYQISEESIQESIQQIESVSNSVRSLAQRNQPTSAALHRVSSEVSSEYSEDFDQSAEKESSASKSSKIHTMAKLQAKAKDLEESNAYSERFDEESQGQSLSTSQHPKIEIIQSSHKMESVKEESIDESIDAKVEEAAPEPFSEKYVVDSLPSEDVEIKDSGKSTDWQIQIKERSRQRSIAEDKSEDKQEEIEEDFEDLNEREDKEIEDLQSCPEDIGKSQSENYLFAQADAIAEDMLRALLDDYKSNSKFALTIKVSQPDEDEFKNKFPWTLDKVPEPKLKEPTATKKVETPKRIKSEREIADEKFKDEHNKKQAKFDERHTEVQFFLDFMCKRVDLKKLIDALNTPIVRDPLKVLKQIQSYEDEESSILHNDSEQKSSPQQVLPYTFFCKIDKEFVIMQRMQKRKLTQSQAEESDHLTVSQEDEEAAHNIHHYALFEALNDVLDLERPYRTKGEPMPWSNNSRTFKRITTPEQARKLLEKARDKVIEIERTRAGTNLAPLPSVPPQTQDEDGNEIIPPLLSAGEEERKNIQRHTKLAQLMTEDIAETETNWIDYEIQETQARFDLADMILHQLTGEIVSFLQEKTK